jgi:glutathione S-transferase
VSAVLWHIPISHFNEKARWALELKGVEHERRAPPPPGHIAVALWLTRGAVATFPVLVLDGHAIGDSTAIIAALEERFPDPPLYPDDSAERERALTIEDFFDEQLGAYSRRLAFHELRADGDGLKRFAATILPARLARSEMAVSAFARGASVFTRVRYQAGPEAAATESRAKITAAFDRLEAELDTGAGDYLVGDRFTVADLTAAALFAPVVAPPRGPVEPEAPTSLAEYRDSLRERRGFAWVEEIFARHRGDPIRP